MAQEKLDDIMADLLKQAGFSKEELAIKMSAHLPPNERPVTNLTRQMQFVRTACGPVIANKFAEIDGPVSITEMSECNNFDIAYGERRIRIVTDYGGALTIMDGGNLWCMESWPGELVGDPENDSMEAAERIVAYMVGGSEGLYERCNK